MNLKKCVAVLLTAVLLLSAAGAAAQGITLRTISCFAGPDASDEIYVDILRRYEAETGNTVLDSSAASDETWKTSVLSEFAAGNEPDVLFFFAAGADSRPILSRVVPLEEINREYPELRLPETEALREEDGSVYAVPVRGYWEGLYVHTDLFEQYGAPLPRDWDSLLEAIRIFRENDIIPIAVSLSDIPHYVAELAILACAGQEDQQARPKTLAEVPESWKEAMRVIRELAEAGAFADNAWATYDSAAMDVFLTKKAAMRLDGSWFATSIPPAWMDTMEVLPMPRRNGDGVSDCYIGGVSMGFYLTRRAWNSARRDAAVQLLSMLTAPENVARLGDTTLTGHLQASAEDMQEGRMMLSPLQDSMSKNAREVWLLECIPAVADGSMTAEQCWEKVMALAPFGK